MSYLATLTSISINACFTNNTIQKIIKRSTQFSPYELFSAFRKC